MHRIHQNSSVNHSQRDYPFPSVFPQESYISTLSSSVHTPAVMKKGNAEDLEWGPSYMEAD
jgi:hypothetical protein